MNQERIDSKYDEMVFKIFESSLQASLKSVTTLSFSKVKNWSNGHITSQPFYKWTNLSIKWSFWQKLRISFTFNVYRCKTNRLRRFIVFQQNLDVVVSTGIISQLKYISGREIWKEKFLCWWIENFVNRSDIWIMLFMVIRYRY